MDKWDSWGSTENVKTKRIAEKKILADISSRKKILQSKNSLETLIWYCFYYLLLLFTSQVKAIKVDKLAVVRKVVLVFTTFCYYFLHSTNIFITIYIGLSMFLSYSSIKCTKQYSLVKLLNFKKDLFDCFDSWQGTKLFGKPSSKIGRNYQGRFTDLYISSINLWRFCDFIQLFIKKILKSHNSFYNVAKIGRFLSKPRDW